ncbi:MAG: serine/threonine protein kinase, partial [Myxococcaceae bacterium]
MNALQNYQLTDEIYKTLSTTVVRARRKADGAAVILKYPTAERPSMLETARFRHEYDILKLFDSKQVVRAYGLEVVDHRPLLVCEDTGATSIGDYCRNRRLSAEEFLTMALEVCDALAAIHAKRVIHKDINPSNIVISPNKGTVQLIDLGIATRLSRETQEVRNPDQLEGTLQYMSPEQTGRMNRTIDYRSDLYSLGATFYTLLTGVRPFDTDDAMELIHCHIAKEPPPVSERRKDLPEMISKVISKLMAKTVEQRFQSVHGLRASLTECLRQLKETGTVVPFELERDDVPQQFEVRQELYGRAKEVQSLLEAFGRVSQGGTELLLVAGYSGIGKSALINEVHKPIVRQRGYFISGKYDQFNRATPYSAIS